MSAPSRRAVARRVPLVLALVAALMVATLAPATDASAQVDAPAEMALVHLVDGTRGAHGAGALRVCADLRDLARSWSARMADDRRLSHNPDLMQVRGWRSLGEIVGVNPSASGVHARFMDSTAHRAHILSTRYTEVGIGVERRDGTLWVTAVFREPDGTAPCTVVPLDERISTACPPALVPTAAFGDVRGNVHREAVGCLVWYDLTNGTRSGVYSPADPLTRAQMATLITRLAQRSGMRLPAPRHQGFTDIAGNPHADAINQLAELGVVQGLTPTTYGPGALVTRAQMATFLVRGYEQLTGETLTRSRDWFADDNGLVHEDAINKAAEADFVTGYSRSTYGPHHRVRRDQVASFLARTLNRLVERGHLSPPRPA